MSDEDAPRGIPECDEVRAALSEYRDGELDSARRVALERHLAECGRCARFGSAFMSTIDELCRHLLTRADGAALRDQIDHVLAVVAREAKR